MQEITEIAGRGDRRAYRPGLSREEVLELGTPDFLDHLGKHVINPGGIEGRDRVLGALKIAPDSHVLEIGSGNGRAACHIAQRYGCKVTTIDISPFMVNKARALVAERGLADRVRCVLGDVHALGFADNTFDHVVCQGVIMYTRPECSLAEVRRVLREEGRFAGQEICWRRLPPDSLREATARLCGSNPLCIHSRYGWIGMLREAGFDAVEATEHPFDLFRLKGFLRDEGWLNTLRIGAKLVLCRAKRAKLSGIRSHFFRHDEYFSYVVFSGRKKTVARMRPAAGLTQ